MTATVQRDHAGAGAGSTRPGRGRVLGHSLTIAWRDLIQVRSPQLLVFSAVQAIMFVLLFNYVFGGAIQTPGVEYLDFLIPGIVVWTVAFASFDTGIGLNQDLSKGMVDRFRSLPIARSAYLTGRILADTVPIMGQRPAAGRRGCAARAAVGGRAGAGAGRVAARHRLRGDRGLGGRADRAGRRQPGDGQPHPHQRAPRAFRRSQPRPTQTAP
jgi:hypothetical protein